MNITLYSFTKRKNSTKLPTGGTTYTGTLKDNTSVVAPSITFSFSSFPAYNYAYIQEFSRYYWITDKTQVSNNIWVLSFKVDVLASYKTEIGSSSKYILRSASAYDGNITDIKYPTKAVVNAKRTTHAPFSGTGRYLLGVVTPDGIAGAVTYYTLSESQMATVRSTLMGGQSYFGNITDPDIRNFAILMGNPMQYIKSCRYYPFNIGTGVSANMTLGNTVISNMNILYGTTQQDTFTFTINNHPLYTSRGRYTSWEPFTQRFLYFPPVGFVHLPSALYAHFAQLTGIVNIDLVSGIGRLIIQTPSTSDNDPCIVYSTSFAAGFDVPLAQLISGNPIKIVSGVTSLFSAGVSAMTGNIGGLVQGALSAVSDFISANVPEVRGYIDGGGSQLETGNIEFLEVFYDIADDNNAEFGRPLMAVRTLNTLSGYILCADGEIETDGTEPEITELESYLTGGFFYE